jgi:hypothetical protein
LFLHYVVGKESGVLAAQCFAGLLLLRENGIQWYESYSPYVEAQINLL